MSSLYIKSDLLKIDRAILSCLLNANKDPFSSKTVCRNLLTILPAITAPETLDLIRTVQLFTSHAAAAANHYYYSCSNC